MRSHVLVLLLVGVSLTTASFSAEWHVTVDTDGPRAYGGSTANPCPPPPMDGENLRDVVYCASHYTVDSDENVVHIAPNVARVILLPGSTTFDGPLLIEDVAGNGPFTMVGDGPTRPIISSADLVSPSGSTNTRLVFATKGNASITFRHVELANGLNPLGGAFHCNSLASTASNRFDDVVFRNNWASDNSFNLSNGGAILTYPTLIVENSQFIDNHAAIGGAIWAANYHASRIENSEFIDNVAQTNGGALNYSFISFSILGSTFSGNRTTSSSSGQGGGAIFIENPGPSVTSVISNSTFVRNQVLTGSSGAEPLGGAIYATGSGNTVVRHSTLADNTAAVIAPSSVRARGGGIAVRNGHNVTLSNTIIARNSVLRPTTNGGTPNIPTASDCDCNEPGGPTGPSGVVVVCYPPVHAADGLFTRLGTPQVQVIDDPNCAVPGAAPTVPTGLAATIADNGGPTHTLALAADAAAADAADDAECQELQFACPGGVTPCAVVDQRSITRPQLNGAPPAKCDVGAYERRSQANLGITKTVDQASPEVGTSVTYTLSATNAGPDTAYNVSVSDPLPLGVTYESSTPVGACGVAAGIVTCSVTTLAAGASLTYAVTVSVDTAGTITNTGHITSDTPDDTPGNNDGGVPIDAHNPPAATGGGSTGATDGGATTSGVAAREQGNYTGSGAIGPTCRASGPDIFLIALALLVTWLRRPR